MRMLVCTGVSAIAALAIVATVFAHAEPATAKPGDGAVLTKAPGEVVLEMSQEMGRQAGNNDIDVFDSSGKEVTTIAAILDNADRKRLSVALPSDLPPGKYTVKWKTLSADDGDAADGSISFTVDPNATPSAGKEQLRDDLLGGDDDPTTGDAGVVLKGADDGVTWVLVIAVGIAALVLGAGGTFLLVQRKP